MTYTDAVVAQKVVNMRHTLHKSNLNVSFADPKGGGGAKAPPVFPTDPYGVPRNYPAHPMAQHVQPAVPQYPFPAHPQQQPAYTISYGTPIPRTDPVPNPNLVRTYGSFWACSI